MTFTGKLPNQHQMLEVTQTGGARIGFKNASWPLATLHVTRTELSIKVFIFGTYTFLPEDIIAIEPYTVIPYLGRGLRIRHRKEEYNQRIIFWTFRKPKELLAEIQRVFIIP